VRSRRGRQEKRRLADARFASDENERSGDEAAAEDAVELGNAGREARCLLRAYRAELDGLECRDGPLRRRAVELLDEAAERPTAGHFPSQRPDVVPHSAQVNWTVTFATKGSV
jgi:hypothetical protein